MKVARQWQIVLRKQHQQVAQGKKVRKAVKKRLKRVGKSNTGNSETSRDKSATGNTRDKTNTTAQPAENSSENDRQTSISPRWVPNNQVIYPRITLAFTNESGQAFADENLTLSGTYTKFGYEDATSLWRPYAVNYPITSSNAGGGQYRVAVNATVPLPYDFFTDLPANYRMNIYAVEQLKIDNTLKYVDSIVAVPDSTLRMTRYSAQQTTELPQFGNHMTPFVLRTRDSIFSKSSENVFSLNTDGNEF